MELQWYPGHMAKTMRVVEEYLPLVDVVVEIIDARVPVSSSNPELRRRIGGRPRIVALNKADLAEADATSAWATAFRRAGASAIAIEAQTGKGVNDLLRLAIEQSAARMERERARGRRARPARIMVAGIPNVGKSSLINRLTRRGSARTGAMPGVTRGKQWVRINEGLELLDLPGVLWPKFEDPLVGYHLAATGAISEQVYDHYDVARRLLGELLPEHADALTARFEFERLPDAPEAIIDEVGRRRGCLRGGGSIDSTAAADIVLREFRLGKLGRITLEKAVTAHG
ncbi:MAG: ribosome biogenesis GTPase YlqF [Chloroflexota bacterium]